MARWGTFIGLSFCVDVGYTHFVLAPRAAYGRRRDRLPVEQLGMTSYHAHILPHEGDQLKRYSEKYSQLRVQALQQSPDAFSSTLQDECSKNLDEKLDRLRQRGRETIIISSSSFPPDNGSADWIDEEWVGQVTLIGPMSKEEYFAPFRIGGEEGETVEERYTFLQQQVDGDNAQDEDEDGKFPTDRCYYHMTSLYVDANYRGKGLAKLLCEESFKLATAQAISSSATRRQGAASSNNVERVTAAEMRIIIKPTNTVVMKMYSRLGFRTADQKSTLAQAIVASGDLAALPSDYLSKKSFNTPGGIIMIKKIAQ